MGSRELRHLVLLVLGLGCGLTVGAHRGIVGAVVGGVTGFLIAHTLEIVLTIGGDLIECLIDHRPRGRRTALAPKSADVRSDRLG